MKKTSCILLSLLLSITLLLSGCGLDSLNSTEPSQIPAIESSASSADDSQPIDDQGSSDAAGAVVNDTVPSAAQSKPEHSASNSVNTVSLDSIPAFSGAAYIAINNNTPYFSSSEYTTKSFESYSNLDSKGRCGVAYACIGKDIMPTEERGSIGSVKPTGWQTVKYDCVDGKYLYNRCHLIGYQLSGENANTKNLITGTRYLNVDGMLPFENMVADYIKETNNHVLYRVTPMFDGNNLVASGVLMEAYSVEDDGDGICFNVYCYNNQPSIKINYADGSSSLIGEAQAPVTSQETASTENISHTYVLNTNTHKFHLPSCSSAKKIADKNKKEVNTSRDELIAQGYDPCKNCNP